MFGVSMIRLGSRFLEGSMQIENTKVTRANVIRDEQMSRLGQTMEKKPNGFVGREVRQWREDRLAKDDARVCYLLARLTKKNCHKCKKYRTCPFRLSS